MIISHHPNHPAVIPSADPPLIASSLAHRSKSGETIGSGAGHVNPTSYCFKIPSRYHRGREC
eukprot:1871143-Karenia_brevis.AAC.1